MKNHFALIDLTQQKTELAQNLLFKRYENRLLNFILDGDENYSPSYTCASILPLPMWHTKNDLSMELRMKNILLFSSGSISRSIITESLLSPILECMHDCPITLYSSGMVYDHLEIENTRLLLKENHHRTNHLNIKRHDEIKDSVFDLTFLLVNFLVEKTVQPTYERDLYYVAYQGLDSDLEQMYSHIKLKLIETIKQLIFKEFDIKACAIK